MAVANASEQVACVRGNTAKGLGCGRGPSVGMRLDCARSVGARGCCDCLSDKSLARMYECTNENRGKRTEGSAWKHQESLNLYSFIESITS